MEGGIERTGMLKDGEMIGWSGESGMNDIGKFERNYVAENGMIKPL